MEKNKAVKEKREDGGGGGVVFAILLVEIKEGLTKKVAIE